DGDRIRNQRDRDMDGDGIKNSRDKDIDGDGIPNKRDRDMDCDGIPNFEDDDSDASGLSLGGSIPDVHLPRSFFGVVSDQVIVSGGATRQGLLNQIQA